MRGRLCDSGSVLGLPHVAKLLRAEKSQDGRQVVCLRPKRLARPVPEIKPGKIKKKGKNWTHQRRKYANQHEALISGMYCRSRDTVAPVPVEASEVIWVKNDVDVAVPDENRAVEEQVGHRGVADPRQQLDPGLGLDLVYQCVRKVRRHPAR